MAKNIGWKSGQSSSVASEWIPEGPGASAAKGLEVQRVEMETAAWGRQDLREDAEALRCIRQVLATSVSVPGSPQWNKKLSSLVR